MRVEGKGLIDRNAPVSFQFDGKSYFGFQGDTLASALLANGVKIVETLVGFALKRYK